MLYPDETTAHVLFFALAIVTSTAIGLVAVWSAMSPRHWFLRVAGVGAVLLLGVTVGAYDLVFVYFIQTLVVFVALQVATGLSVDQSDAADGASRNRWPRRLTKARFTLRLTKGRNSKPQFFLSDALLGILVVAVVLAVATYAPTDLKLSWARLSLRGGTFAAVTLAATWLSLGARRFWLRLAVFCLILPTAGIPLADSTLPFEIFPPEIGWWSSVLTVVGGLLMAAWLALARHLQYARRRPYFVVPIFALLSLMVFAVPAAAYLRLLNPVAIPSEPLPEPNVYDELVRLGQLVEDPMISDLENATPAALRAFVNKHAANLKATHAALKYPWRVPFSLEINEIGPFRELARALLAQAKLAQIEGRTDEAWQAYQETIRLGGARSDGGVLVDYMVGVAIVGMGVDGMGQAIDSLAANSTAEQCHQVLTYLQTVEAREVPATDILHREKAWSEYALGWLARLYSALGSIAGTTDRRRRDIEKVENQRRTKLRLVICEIALQEYQAKHGALPERLKQLVPKYLPAVPLDPFAGKPLTYHLDSPDSYRLYSIGRDRVDDGGRPEIISGGDMTYQTDAANPKP